MSGLSFAARAAFLGALALCLARPACAATALALSSTTAHPQGSTRLSGNGFAANEAIDVFFDTTDVLLEISDASGKFGPDKITIPANALPGDHWITVIGRKNGDAAHRKFIVSTAWLSHGFNERGRRRNPYENVLNITVANRLDLAWSAALGGEVFSSPAVSQVGAAAYNPFIFVGSRDGNIQAFDAAGRLKWAKATGDSVDSSPAVDGGVVYVGSEVGKVFAFHAANGAAAWSSPVTVDGSADSSPAVANGVVYIGTGNGFLYALKTLDGSAVWPSPATTPGAFPWSPAVADGIVYVSASDGKVYAFKTADGSPAWAAPADMGSPTVSSPAVANGNVYVGARDDKLHALNARTGAVIWLSAATGGFVDSSPAVANGVVYVGSNDGKLYALNANTGATIWAGTTGGAIGISSPAVANNTVFVGSADKRLYAFSTTCSSTCLPSWTAATGSVIESSPVVSDGMVFAGSDDAHLYAFALDAGNDAVYRQRHAAAPSYASLHPDFRLKPVRHTIVAQ